MSDKLNFVDDTFLNSPNPIHTSSMLSGSQRLNLNICDDLPPRLCDTDNSLGLLSFDRQDIPFEQSPAVERRKSESGKAGVGVNLFTTDITRIPSFLLQATEKSDNSTGMCWMNSESTINESDLFPGNTSTPRTSLMCDDLDIVRRKSVGKSLLDLASSLRDPSFSIRDISRKVQETIGFKDGSFKSGLDVVTKLDEDELSWKKQKNIPELKHDFSMNSFKSEKASLGPFFIARSDDLPNLFAKSPQKMQTPEPLIENETSYDLPEMLHKSTKTLQYPQLSIENSTACQDLSNLVDVDSLGVTDIQQILSSDVSTRDAITKLYKGKRASKSPSKTAGVEARKENISPDFQNKSIISSRSSSALSSLPNGKLPIATTKTELIFGCLKPGKTNAQEIVIRNRSTSRISIYCTVTNPAFRLHKDSSESNFTSMLKIILHSYESRSLHLTFAPTTLGAAVDMLKFTSADVNLTQSVKQFIKLFGYGGHGKVTIQKIMKDTNGKFLISLGNVDEQQNLGYTFVVKNCGTLPTFSHFDVAMNGLYSFAKVEVFPDKLVLLPGEEREIRVSCSIEKKDYNFIKSKIGLAVIEIGKLQVTHGTEVDRMRLRKIGLKAKEQNLNIISDSLNIVSKFPGEVVPNDIKYFREAVSSLEEVSKLLTKEEIIVTFEQAVDTTVIGQHDETAIHSLCENSTFLESTNCKESCFVDPATIILTPPDKVQDRIFLTNNNQKTLYFEVNSTPEGLFVKPSEGTIRPNETRFIELGLSSKCNNNFFKVRILVDNERFDVDVKIMYVNSVSGGRT